MFEVSDDEDDTIPDTVSEAPSSLIISDLTEETLKEKLEKLKTEQNTLLEKRLAKAEQECEEIKIDRNQIK